MPHAAVWTLGFDDQIETTDIFRQIEEKKDEHGRAKIEIMRQQRFVDEKGEVAVGDGTLVQPKNCMCTQKD